ncbi:MAG: exodeoxyribonuclease VII large subunit [Ignavibacteriae bacterium HGW-Ignavibacteriae-1]|jgi:exodeoxyribonuclease VII large subunit|nr:MAG: exodeoxyribonuclease VII large subunit [Ignavibacteriae bacterium HGW-Ignavibacteriae-1]
MKLTRINFESTATVPVPTVSQLTNRIRSVLESDFGQISVMGEVSNFTAHTSGHRYFSLKDEQSSISCVMWRGKAVSFQIKDGLKVKLTGKVTVYPPQGRYQIDVSTVMPAGEGDLYLAYEALKQKLQEKGYFAQERKKILPGNILKIGVSTSPTGAAVRDIISTIERRFPLATIYFRPTLVQGEGSAQDIAKAIAELDNLPLDVIIIGRGGGSIEDLWAYNEEIVANAIFNAKKPIISAVGHETDFTIADFVADLRAATPTASAEIVTSVTLEDYMYHIDVKVSAMQRAANRVVEKTRNLITKTFAQKGLRRIQERIAILKQNLKLNTNSMMTDVRRQVDFAKNGLQSKYAVIKANDPKAPLNKGYALLSDGKAYITNEQSLNQFTAIQIIRKNETVEIKLNQ